MFFDPRYDMLSFMMKSLRIYFSHCVLFSAGGTSVSTLAEATNKRLLYAGNATVIFPQFKHNFGIEGNSHSLLAFVGVLYRNIMKSGEMKHEMTLLVSTYVVCERLSVMHKQVSG